MNPNPVRQTTPSLTATALAVALLLSACGGGDADPPAGSTDTTAPTVTITDNISADTASGEVVFTFNFSEDVGTSFSADDIVVSGGSKGSFTQVSSTQATLVVMPTSNASGMVQVSVAVGSFSDAAGNANTAAASAEQGFNTVVVESGATGLCTAAPCIGFEAAGLALTAFGGMAAEVVADPVDSGNKVVRYVKTPDAETWAGATVDSSGSGAGTVTPFGFAENKTVTLRAYSPAVGETIMLKVENAADGGVFMEARATTTVAGAWETLSFDFASPSNGSYNPAKTYNRVSIFPHFDSKVSAESVYYFDELSYTAGEDGGGEGPLTDGMWASNYGGAVGIDLKSSEGGDAGRFVDPSATQIYDWSGVAPLDTHPSFYFGYGFDGAGSRAGYFGAYVKAPANGNIDLSGYANLKLNVWGNGELINLNPTISVVLQGPAVSGCGSNSGGSEVKSSFVATTTNAADAYYSLPLSAFTIQYACNGETSAAQVLASISQINLLLLDSNIQYTTKDGDGTAYPNGLNVGRISFE